LTRPEASVSLFEAFLSRERSPVNDYAVRPDPPHSAAGLTPQNLLGDT